VASLPEPDQRGGEEKAEYTVVGPVCLSELAAPGKGAGKGSRSRAGRGNRLKPSSAAGHDAGGEEKVTGEKEHPSCSR